MTFYSLHISIILNRDQLWCQIREKWPFCIALIISMLLLRLFPVSYKRPILV